MSELRATDLPAFQQWSRSFEPPADAAAYLSQNLSVTSAALFADLLFPRMVVVRHCVLLEDRYDAATFDQWWESTGGDPVAVERALNHLHLWDVFEPEGDPEERALEQLAHQVANAWTAHAQRQFPDRAFISEVTDEYGPTVVLTTRPTGSSSESDR
ncbi:hypothetical protein [Promicromonospora sp. MEB111]|uniref:hypothetical protein n=1 Tax=Promicromonospora sp. MEB111 TaxID=3040301 RepID=UPI0025509CED|nr:hypothetical protein [Promicromonospora sp. MEB111]